MGFMDKLKFFTGVKVGVDHGEEEVAPEQQGAIRANGEDSESEPAQPAAEQTQPDSVRQVSDDEEQEERTRMAAIRRRG
jgi:hypothetical protein